MESLKITETLTSERYSELSHYTLAHRSKDFIHQHFVDVFTAQKADVNGKPIAITFALVGLYLFIERGCTGRQVQQIHMQMAKNKRTWPTFKLPEKRGEITIVNVLRTPSGESRDEMIKKWCESVWEAYRDNHTIVKELLQSYLPNI